MGFIIHLRVETESLALAQALALEVVDTLHRRQPEFDCISTQISPEFQQDKRHFLLCGKRLGSHDRCVRLYCHTGDHSVEWP